ncbi:condensin complex subunit 2-like [Euwallacea similis]|uniref:condensin complex subunit 2-like n=1 Tax=Euwallacea similis TaxID=1736056 RepID=UPI00344ED228
METSSPMVPLKLKTKRNNLISEMTLITPLRRGHAQRNVLDESNDDVERAERRRSVAIRKSIQALPPPEPSSSVMNDSIIALSEEELKTQLQTFYRLHTENKINVKNAWSLRVIDVLKQIITKNQPDVLKVAGNSLEIAARVYGLRVDDLYSEGLKLAGNLARNFARPQDVEDENAEGLNASEPEAQKKKQRKKRALVMGSKKFTVNDDPKVFLCQVARLESAIFSAREDPSLSVTGNLFTNKVPMDPIGYKFMFVSKEPGWRWEVGSDLPVSSGDSEKFPVDIRPVNQYHLCAPFTDFRLDLWDPEENNDLLTKSTTLDEVVLDDKGIPIAELDGSIHDIFADGNDQGELEDLLTDEEEVEMPLRNRDLETIVNFYPTEQGLVSNVERSVYSFNNVMDTAYGKVDQIWAGPSHWKLKFIRNNSMVYAGKDRKEEERRKTKPLKRKFEPQPFDWMALYHNTPSDLDNKGTRLKKKKCIVVDTRKILMPLRNTAAIKMIENMEYLCTIPTMKVVKKKPLGNEVDYYVSGYNYDNPNDSHYCPPQSENIHDNEDDTDNPSHDMDCSFPKSIDEYAPEFTGDNMVDAPYMVQQSFMHYATRAKKMDMKKLKESVWCALTQKTKFDTSAQVKRIQFSQMYQQLPQFLDEKVASELSCPLAFVALLHLCNEQNLSLKSQNDYDFCISNSNF